jgi:hypothetical protein
MLAGSKFSFYAIEARPYALLVAATSLSLASRALAWPIFWLASVVCLHFYGVFVVLALALAERGWRRRAAFLLALSPLLVTLPAMHPPRLLSAGELVAPKLENLAKTLPVLAGGSAFAVLLLLLGGSVWWLRHRPLDLFRGTRDSWALLGIVPACWLAGEAATGIYCIRYAIVSLLGVTGMVAWFVHRLPYRAMVATGFSLLCLTGSLLKHNLMTMESWDARPAGRLIAQTIAATRQPVVMGDSPYLEARYYVSPEQRNQFWRLTPERFSYTAAYAYAPGKANRWAEMVSKYGGFTPVGLEDWLARHKSFTVLAESESDWILTSSRRRGARIAPVGRSAPYLLYSVRLPGPAITGSRSPSPLRVR